MSGQYTLYDPGRKVAVTLTADSNGNVATGGQVVTLTGENAEHPEAALNGTAGAGVGHLDADADDYDPDASYSAGDVVGRATVLLRKPVDWFETSATLSVGDLVVYDTSGGVRAYDSAGGDTPEMIVGRVFRTIMSDPGTQSKVAVARRF